MAEQELWQPISSEQLRCEINNALVRMNPQQRMLWHVIRIAPEKWQQDPFGREPERSLALVADARLPALDKCTC